MVKVCFLTRILINVDVISERGITGKVSSPYTPKKEATL